jgi:chromate transporter
MPATNERSLRLQELARLFLKLGLTAFGGPAAHVAMMEDEVVRRRGWLTREKFLDLLGASNLIPGPSSTELVIHIGRERAGWPGLLVAGSCFIVPAALLSLALAWGYVRYGTLPATGNALYGVKPVVVAIVLQALWTLGRAAVRSRIMAAAAVVATAAAFAGVSPLLLLVAAGATTSALRMITTSARGGTQGGAALFIGGASGAGGAGGGASRALPLGATAAAGTAAVAAFGLWPLFLFFLKTGAVVFGSGYVLLAFLRADLVERWHWLTQAQLLDAIAVGQVTPGPVFTTATFIGYLLGRVPGAAVATIGIFLPAFALVALSGLVLPRLRRSPTAGAFLDGVNVASLALMADVTWHLGRATIVDPITATLALGSALVLLRFRTRPAWLVLAGALVGVATRAGG